MRNVVFAAPFPLPTTMRFALAAARLPGVRLLGLFAEAPSTDDARLFADVVRLKDGLDTRQLIDGARLLERRHGKLHRVLGILETLQVQLGAVRHALGVPGPGPETAARFRDKSRMKDELRRHGLPCARHRLCASAADAHAFAAEVGFPLVVKPPAGMGCKATWRIGDARELDAAMRALHASPSRPALAEEFLRGEEHSLETITVGGEVRFASVSNYHPAPLEVMEQDWIQWVVILPREQDGPGHVEAHALAVRTVQALGLETGFTHMEWFRRDDGRLAIGEIAARPPGANLVTANGYAHNADMHRAWARAVVDDAFDGPFERRYAVGIAFLRGAGKGRIARVTGVAQANESVGHLVVESRLPRPGEPRSSSYEGNGYVIVRHPETRVVEAAMKTVIETIRVEHG